MARAGVLLRVAFGALPLVGAAGAGVWPGPASCDAAELTGRATLSAAYDQILDARFDEAARTLTACAGAPPEACLVLEAARLWWQIQLDPESRARDATFTRVVDEAITATEAWAAREPRRAEAWFYVGGAYGARAQWRVLRGARLAAARDGKPIKSALERALQLDPALEDANFGIGLYQYYADVAPAAARFLRWLLLLPGGNKTEGLARMVRAGDRGQLLRGEAEFQLHVIYLWYEKDVGRALELLADLTRRYPRNPLYPLLAADVHETYVHDPSSSARVHAQVLRQAQQRQVEEPALAEARARLGLARLLDTLFESDRALEHARAVIAAEPPSPHGALAEAWLLAGRAQARLGEAREADLAYQTALARIPSGDPGRIAERVRASRRLRVDAASAAVYRQALAGWRAFERGDLASAESILSAAVSKGPADMVTRYRLARVLAARGKTADAERALEIVAGSGATTPAVIFAEACADLGARLEARGELARARLLYDRAAQTFGADARTRADARAKAARLRASARGRRAATREATRAIVEHDERTSRRRPALSNPARGADEEDQ